MTDEIGQANISRMTTKEQDFQTNIAHHFFVLMVEDQSNGGENEESIPSHQRTFFGNDVERMAREGNNK